uniref:Uncharacterized protein n=1 Tax=Eutreptiella gymnastica TaxID=73025 RepID=A0A7S4FZI1_9EUGL
MDRPRSRVREWDSASLVHPVFPSPFDVCCLNVDPQGIVEDSVPGDLSAISDLIAVLEAFTDRSETKGAYPKLQQLLEDLQSLLVLLRGSAILTDDFPTPVDVIENNQLLYLGRLTDLSAKLQCVLQQWDEVLQSIPPVDVLVNEIQKAKLSRHDPDEHVAPDAVESVQKDHKKGWDDDWWRHSKRYMAKRNLQFKMVQCLEEPDLDGQVVAYVAHVHEALNVGSKTLWATLGVLKHSRAHCNHLCEDEWQELADRFDEDVKEDIEYLEEDMETVERFEEEVLAVAEKGDSQFPQNILTVKVFVDSITKEIANMKYKLEKAEEVYESRLLALKVAEESWKAQREALIEGAKDEEHLKWVMEHKVQPGDERRNCKSKKVREEATASLNQMRDFVEDRRKYLMSQRDAANSDKERTVQLEQQRQMLIPSVFEGLQQLRAQQWSALHYQRDRLLYARQLPKVVKLVDDAICEEVFAVNEMLSGRGNAILQSMLQLVDSLATLLGALQEEHMDAVQWLDRGLLASMTMIEFTVDTSDPSAHQYESVLQSLADVRDQIADARERQASLRRDCLEVVQDAELWRQEIEDAPRPPELEALWTKVFFNSQFSLQPLPERPQSQRWTPSPAVSRVCSPGDLGSSCRQSMTPELLSKSSYNSLVPGLRSPMPDRASVGSLPSLRSPETSLMALNTQPWPVQTSPVDEPLLSALPVKKATMSASLLWPAVPRTSSVSTVHTPSSRLQLPSLGPDTPERTRRARSLRGLLPDRERHFMPLVSAGPVDRRALWTPGTLDPPASRATCSRQSHRADWDVLLDPLYHNPEAFEPQRFTPLKSMFQ